jgi:hypothetical protein
MLRVDTEIHGKHQQSSVLRGKVAVKKGSCGSWDGPSWVGAQEKQN